MDLTRLDPEEKTLASRLSDLSRSCERGAGSRFSSFLNERQQQIAEAVFFQRGIGGCLLYGGYPDAVRRMAGVFPEWETPDGEAFPIAAVAIHLPKGAAVTHRDVLGSLMSLRITRESIGDILIQERLCHVFVQEPLAPVVLDELTKIGGTGVRCERSTGEGLVRDEAFQELRGTVSSPRVDALVRLLTGLSREKGTALIAAERVQLNYRTVTSQSAAFSPGDVVTIRGYGKFRVDGIGPPTKKCRLPVYCRKYI